VTQLKLSAAGLLAPKSNLVMLSPLAAMLCIETLALKDPTDHIFIVS
jgi:hypothetical protein